MKKITYTIFLIISIFLLITGCTSSKKSQTSIDVSTFTDKEWSRETEADTEYITFSSNGSFSYFCACGEPVNDSDLCDGYTYDSKTNTITLNYFETTDETVTKILVKRCTKDILELDFNEEIRRFS